MATPDWDALNAGLKRLKLRKIRDLLNREGVRDQLDTFDDPIELVAHLVNEEVCARDRTQRENRFRQAGFPAMKTLEDFDFSLQPSVQQEEIRFLAGLDFLRARENVIFVGPAGIGKTHLSISLGMEAVEAGYAVRFITAGQLVDALYASLADGTFKRELKRYGAFDLIVIDELGYLSLDKTASDHFFEVINQAYENQSIILTTNRPFQEWATLFDDAITVSAILDRLLHHAHLFNMKGDSYRLRQHLNQEGNTVI